MTRLQRRTGRSPKESSDSLALVVIDERPLKASAWERLLFARSRLTRSTKELHRHELTDEPAYRAWMAATCPALLSEIRELTMLCESKSSLIARVREQAWRLGKTPAVIWHALKHSGQVGADSHSQAGTGFDDQESEEDATGFQSLLDELIRQRGLDAETAERSTATRRSPRHDRKSPAEADAREIYRRLVQRLHPDRGGEWSIERETLWHEVQRAWDSMDGDWLARLDAESEVSAAVLHQDSPLGKITAAFRQMEAARRDAERKLRRYRKAPSWEFSTRSPSEADANRVAAQLREDRDHLRRTLAGYEATFAQWEKPLGQARARQRTEVQLTPRPESLKLA